MKFLFTIAFFCANLCFAFGQIWPNILINQFTYQYPNSYTTANPNRYQNSNRYPNPYPNPSSRNDGSLQNYEKAPSTSLSLNSCEKYWTLQNDGNGVWGQLSITSTNKEKAVVRVVLTLAAALPTEYVGDIELLYSKESTSDDVANGLPIEYRVRFPLQHPLPKLTELYYNNQLLCRGQKAYGSVVTTISLDHTYVTGLFNNNFYNPNPYPQRPRPIPTQPPNTQPPITYRPVTYRPTPYQPETYPTQTRRPPTRPPQIVTEPTQIPMTIDEKIIELSYECGNPQVNFRNVTSLVVNGKRALRGQFPWLAAYFHNDIGDSGFICGGSLVSSKIVITAAHCINEKGDDSIVRQPDQALIHLGRHNIQNSNERGYLISGATKFIIHPEWKPKKESYDADIAAIVLTRIIPFTPLIQPICLWDSTNNYADIIDHQGVVAGFGKTKPSIGGSDFPYWSELPVVDERTCLESNAVFVNMTSRRTFCAGKRDGSGPCNGDSGGAFIVNSKSDGKYYLRGIVSSSLFSIEKDLCDTTNYAVFTDAAAFKDWIYTQIITYE